jgi:hypothetical protein
MTERTRKPKPSGLKVSIHGKGRRAPVHARFAAGLYELTEGESSAEWGLDTAALTGRGLAWGIS